MYVAEMNKHVNILDRIEGVSCLDNGDKHIWRIVISNRVPIRIFPAYTYSIGNS